MRIVLTGFIAIVLFSLVTNALSKEIPSPSNLVVYPKSDTLIKKVSSDWFVELMGSLVLVSINYEYFLTKPWSMRIGAGIYFSGDENNSAGLYDVGGVINSALTTQYFIPISGRHSIEIGTGVYYNITAPQFDMPVIHRKTRLLGLGILGYRYEKFSSDDALFRITFTPFFDNKGFYPWIGFSYGW